MTKNYTVVSVTPEMLMPELGEPACGANSRGGLGILAGDTMSGLAQRGINAIGFAPLYHQHWMTKEIINYDTIAPKAFEQDVLGNRINVRPINRAGITIYGLEHRDIFRELYAADRGERLTQEVILGHAVPAVLKKLGIKPDIFWMQEGHTAIVMPIVLEEPFFDKKRFLFTTHTPVPEGMEKFFVNDFPFDKLKIHGKYYNTFVHNGFIDMTRASMILAHKVNAVSREHECVTKNMFPEFCGKITGITNGSDRDLWLSPRLKGFENTNNITTTTMTWAHKHDKQDFIDFIARETGKKLDPQKPILGWVRRLAWYKQQCPMLAPIIDAICADKGTFIEVPCLGRLEGLGFQHFGAGRAHESDSDRMLWMGEFHNWMEQRFNGKFVFIPKYSLELLQRAAWGSDVWFSCPKPGMEACGTSEERAMINGVPDITTRSGGAAEYLREWSYINCTGNGFFIDPYQSIFLYFKLKQASDLYYDWVLNGNDRWLKLRMNAYETGKTLDIVPMIEKYETIFEKLLKMP